MSQRDIETQLREIQEQRELQRKRKKPRSSSKLENFRGEILQLKDMGASYEDIRTWLRKYKKVGAGRSTIWKKVKEWNDA